MKLKRSTLISVISTDLETKPFISVLMLFCFTRRTDARKLLRRSFKLQRSIKLCWSHGSTLEFCMRSANRMRRLWLPITEP